ncbi:uncharacterized protein [Miscanthus floridulus]|uniref:uncharacterized protein n=1 Tax=Miscanthus floridulus TaxID=154761 RepID=UPI0034575EF9
MEPQPGSPTSPPFSPGTTLWDNARAATPSEEMAEPDETKEEATKLEPGRKSTASSSSSSSSSSASSADIPCDIDVVELVNPLAAVPPEPEVDEHGVEAKAVHSATPEDERAAPAVHGAEDKPADCAMPEGGQAAPAGTVHSAEAKPDDWATWPEPPPPVVDDSFASSEGGGAAGAPAPLTEAPQVQTVSPANLGAAGAAGASGFDPGRIPASVFQHRTSVSQAEWSMASNESLFSIQGASDLYPGSRSHFDFYYDEAMAEAADSKLPSLAEGAEPGDAPESREFAAPGSAESAAIAVGGNAKRAAVFRQHESGSGSSSSNFSFAFPILAETSPRKKDVVNSALYQPLEKEREQQQQPQLEPPVSAFMEMMTEEERRRSDTGCCCCGCCWFDCSWCCRSWCCRCPWWRCGCCCSCSCPSFCRCSWCLCS